MVANQKVILLVALGTLILIFFNLTLIRMLKDNPELYQLYKDLVVSGVITAEEFWANRGKVFTIMSTFAQVESVSFIPRARC